MWGVMLDDVGWWWVFGVGWVGAGERWLIVMWRGKVEKDRCFICRSLSGNSRDWAVTGLINAAIRISLAAVISPRHPLSLRAVACPSPGRTVTMSRERSPRRPSPPRGGPSPGRLIKPCNERYNNSTSRYPSVRKSIVYPYLIRRVRGDNKTQMYCAEVIGRPGSLNQGTAS